MEHTMIDPMELKLRIAFRTLERAECELAVRREQRWKENARKLALYNEPEKPLFIRILLNAGIIEERRPRHGKT